MGVSIHRSSYSSAAGDHGAHPALPAHSHGANPFMVTDGSATTSSRVPSHSPHQSPRVGFQGLDSPRQSPRALALRQELEEKHRVQEEDTGPKVPMHLMHHDHKHHAPHSPRHGVGLR